MRTWPLVAFRRRFAFVGLEPTLGKAWREWVVNKQNIDSSLVADIESRLIKMNNQIADDSRLGKQFRIGQSYVTPSYRLDDGIESTKAWFKQVVETEIGPLLEEYWFDTPSDAEKACDSLLSDW